jgi:hypothetical protein
MSEPTCGPSTSAAQSDGTAPTTASRPRDNRLRGKKGGPPASRAPRPCPPEPVPASAPCLSAGHYPAKSRLPGPAAERRCDAARPVAILPDVISRSPWHLHESAREQRPLYPADAATRRATARRITPIDAIRCFASLHGRMVLDARLLRISRAPERAGHEAPGVGALDTLNAQRITRRIESDGLHTNRSFMSEFTAARPGAPPCRRYAVPAQNAKESLLHLGVIGRDRDPPALHGSSSVRTPHRRSELT